MDEIEKSVGKTDGHDPACSECGGLLRLVGTEQSKNDPLLRVQTLACDACEKDHTRRFPKHEKIEDGA